MSMPFALASFMQVDAICLFQVNTSSISISGYLTWPFNFSLQLSVFISDSCGKFFRWDRNIISSVLLSFRVYYFITSVIEISAHD